MDDKNIDEILERVIVTLHDESLSNNIDNRIQDVFLKDCFYVERDTSKRKQLLFLSNNSCSIKMSNISINFKKAIETAIEVYLTSEAPDNVVSAIKMFILVIAKILNLSTTKLDKEQANIIRKLHLANAYEVPMQIPKLKEFVDEDINNKMCDRNIDRILDELCKLKIIDIIDEQVILKEKVVLNIAR